VLNLTIKEVEGVDKKKKKEKEKGERWEKKRKL
jgi:hypothetical protein